MLRNSLHRYGNQDGVVPAHLHFGKDILNNMIKNKDITALINAETDERMTYLELAEQTAAMALSLTRIGVNKGDVVSICSEKRFEVLPTILGIVCAGATFSPLDLTYGSQPLLHRLKIGRPTVMFCSRAAYDSHKTTFESVGTVQHYIMYENEKEDGCLVFQEFLIKDVDLDAFEPVPVNGYDDLAFIVYSSGTTGLPKGVPVTHISYLLNTPCIVPYSYRGVPVLNTREWYYTYGLLYTLGCVMAGATIVFNINQQPEGLLAPVEKYKIVAIQLAPSTIMELTKSSLLDKYDLSSLKYIMSASTHISGESVQVIKDRLPSLIRVNQIYGMSEAGCITSEEAAPLGSRPGSSGVPCLGFIIKVVDLETRQALGPNQRGEICLKGPCVLKAYINNENPDCIDSEGFFLSGDIGYYDNDGYFYIVNRIKELIKFNDISVAPAEFEALLMQHPAVRQAGVVGQPNEKHGEVPVAFVVLQPGGSASEQELVEYVNSRVTYRMRLAGGVRFVESLPLGPGAKLDRKQLRSMLDDLA